ncbi:hypothetical protein ZWY2020_039636 [Hordeum vulgare]|nr:hypothetical protein ZWY2020_039636 [Hordeum vulgare]
MVVGWDESFSKKLNWSTDLLEGLLIFFFHERWSMTSTFRGRGSSPSLLLVKLWHPLRLPAQSTLPVNLLAERRPCLFLPTSMPKGKQCFSCFKSTSCFFAGKWSGGAPAVPSGFVPGDDRCVSKC